MSTVGTLVRMHTRVLSGSPDSPWVLQFRQYYTGDRSERQKRLYVGPQWLADLLKPTTRTTKAVLSLL